jgi:hypothetical protein
MYEPLHSKTGNADAERAAGEIQQETFCKQLANDARLRGAQRGANRGLAHTSGNAREQQTGKIGADNEEDSCNGSKEKKEAAAGGSDHFSFERQERAQEIDTFVGLSGNL